MKKLVSMVLILCFMAQAVFADCDWSKIKPLPDGGYEYTPALHLCVGQLVQDNKTKDAQIADLTKAVQLKDLALTNADARTQLWETTAGNEQDRLTKMTKDEHDTSWMMFGLGVATTFLAAYGAAQIIHR